MVTCKYFQQGNCRFGQYCRFEHVGGTFGGQGVGNKSYGDSKSIVLGVAEEVLAAERGGQWLLSCFGPFKEQACIPGMEDVSPEEVRWEMYQAQKNGTVDQTKLQFQQLCQAMTTKREALKNPTHETAEMLEKLQKFTAKSNFVLSTPQLGGSVSGNGNGSGVFTTKSFGTFYNNNNNSNIDNSTSTLFETAPTFVAFTGPQVTNSIFGNSAKPTTSIFGNSSATSTPVTGSQTNTSSFNTATNQSLFNTNQQQNSIFPNTSQSSSAFGASQGGVNIFGGGTSIQQTGAPIFPSASSTIFGQSKNTVAFGSAPIFGASGGGFGATNSGAAFVGQGQGTFTSSGSAFGQTTMNSPFGTSPRTTNSFGSLTTTSQTHFTNAGSSIPFGSSNNSSSNMSDNAPTANLATAASGGFGQAFAPAPPSASLSGAVKVNPPVAFGSAIEPSEKFSNRSSNPFVSITTSTPANNPFISKSQLSGEPLGQSPFARATSEEIIDESVYSKEGDLSDEDKKGFLAGNFTLGSIAIRAPTIELR